MMHNSLLIRELLRRANADPINRARRDPFRALRVDGPSVAAAGELLLQGVWQIIIAGELPGMVEAADDISEFLSRFGLECASSASQQLRLIVEPAIAMGGFRLRVHDGVIELAAGSTRGLWAGLVQLEREMMSRHAPILTRGEIHGQPTWQVQISQAPVGANYLVPDLSPEYLSDDAFRLLAHAGVNGMTIYGDWLCYVRSERFPELNSPDYDANIAVLRDAARRAQRYGVQLYYVPVSPKLLAQHPLFERYPAARGSRLFPGLSTTPKSIHCLCSSDPESLAFHAEVFGNLFKEVPELGGLILIIGGESYYHCFMRPDRRDLPPGVRTNCARCASSQPEQVVNQLLAATAAGVHTNQPDARVMAWSYSGYIWSSDPQYLELVRGLPADVTWMSEIDKDQWMQKDGYQKRIWDYSIDYTGPSDIILAQSRLLEQRDLPLMVKHETALGLEAIHVPYVPSLHRIAQKWANVRSLQPVGVVQSWMFFGMWGSRAEELGWWANWHPDLSAEQVLAEIARRDFDTRAPQALQAWEHLSTAVAHLPYIPNYFTGPEFIGPAHPLFFDPNEPIPELFSALLYYLQENEETFSTTVTEVRQPLTMNQLPQAHAAHSIRVEGQGDVWDVVIREYEQVARASGQAYELLLAATEDVADGTIDTVYAEELILVEMVYRSWLTTVHSLRFLHCRDQFTASADERHRQEMIEIAEQELANARSARHIFVDAPWLDLGRRVDGEFPSSLTMIDAKIALLEQALKHQQAVGR